MAQLAYLLAYHPQPTVERASKRSHAESLKTACYIIIDVRSSPPSRGTIANLWSWRRLIGTLAIREVRVRYAGSLLGVGWVVLEPLLLFGLYLSVFGVFLGIRFAGTGVVGYGIFLLSGLIPFLFFQEVVVRALTLAHAQSQLLRHSSMPPEVLLAGVVLALAGKYVVGMVVVTAAALVGGTLSLAATGWLALGCVLLVAASLGAGLIAFPLGAFAPDAAPIVSLGLNGLLFLTPVLYPLASFPAGVQSWLLYNPLVGVLACFRAAFVGAEVQLELVLVAMVASGALLVGGSLLFRRRARYLREVV